MILERPSSPWRLPLALAMQFIAKVLVGPYMVRTTPISDNLDGTGGHAVGMALGVDDAQYGARPHGKKRRSWRIDTAGAGTWRSRLANMMRIGGGTWATFKAPRHTHAGYGQMGAPLVPA